VIQDFLQHQLLSQVDPSVDLEKRLIDAMGQFIEAEFLSPLQMILREFGGRYAAFESMQPVVKVPTGIRVAILSQTRWKKVVTQGCLIRQFDPIRTKLSDEYRKTHTQSHLIWCDPSSVVEVRVVVDGRPLFFLFNGVQFAAVKKIFKRSHSIEKLQASIPMDDLAEQLATLVGAGLIIEVEQLNDETQKMTKVYLFNHKLDLNVNRNFAKKHTSAENLGLMEMKEFDRKQAVQSYIVRVIKASRGGISPQELQNTVKRDLEPFFPVDREMIREQTRELEVLQYIQLDQKEGEGGLLRMKPENK
jgi:hypothetical protein